MAWLKDYKPTRQELDKAYKAYSGQLIAERAKIRKSSKLVRKDYSNQ